MGRDWHEQFKTWSKPPTDAEEAKGSKAADMIRDALRSYPALQKRNFDVYPTGSYRNNTNVRLGSDIDVAVVLREAVYNQFPSDGSLTQGMLGWSPAKYGLTDFREDVGAALVRKFGSTGMTPGDKAFNVHESNRRLDADVTAFVLHHRYTGRKNSAGAWLYYEGVAMASRKNPLQWIINWHQQHYDEGVKRNEVTNRRFKRVTRILKRLRDDMRESGKLSIAAAAEPIPSFLIESLVFNAPDSSFNLVEGSYYEDIRATIRHLWNGTKDGAACKDYVEVSRMKSLFNETQAWSRENAHEFLLRAWHHVGFE
jgi:hypothetical protein